MTEPAEPDWAAIRHAYERGETLATIRATHTVTKSAFDARRRAEGWPMRNGRRALTRGSLIERLFALFDRQMTELEQRMEPTGDKEVQLLGSLARTLEKLMDLETAHKGKKSDDRRTGDIADLRQRLAARLEKLGRAKDGNG